MAEQRAVPSLGRSGVINISSHLRRVLDLVESDDELRQLVPDEHVLRAVRKPGLLLEKVIDTALEGFNAHQALGERDYEVVVDPDTQRSERRLLQSFNTITYGELRRRVTSLSAAWRHHSTHRVDPGDFVCILGFAGIDYVTVDLAIAYVRGVIVPLQSTLAGADLEGTFANTMPTAVAATTADLALATE